MDKLILKNLLNNSEYVKKVLYHLKPEYFENYSERIIFKIFRNYINKYSIEKLPTATVLKLILSKSSKLTEEQFSQAVEKIDEIDNFENEEIDLKWLIDETEDFCKSKAMENAILKSVDLLQNDEKQLSKIQEMVSEALKVSFDNDLGINYFDEKHIIKRFKNYNLEVQKIPCHLSEMNIAFNGGFEKKSLSVFLGGTHSGKTQSMRSICKDMVEQNYNCVYITFEMSDEKITQGVDANFLNVPINDISDYDENKFKNGLISIAEKSGKLWLKEYPTRGASTNVIKNYIDDLYIKEKFIPDIIFIDYINIMNSDLYSGNQEHLRVKSISEELRGLSVDLNCAVITATQTNRGGDNASDLSLKEIADSFGLTGTADTIIGIISTPELRKQKILIYKIIKNRFGGVIDIKFPVKAETEYSRVSNLKKDEQITLRNSDESKEKMKNLHNKFLNKSLKERKKTNLIFDKDEKINEIDDLLK